MPKNIALKIAIVESGLSQVDIAEAAGIHETKMSSIVNGRRVPSDTEQKAIARLLKRKATDLFPADPAQADPGTRPATPRSSVHQRDSSARLQSRRAETRA